MNEEDDQERKGMTEAAAINVISANYFTLSGDDLTVTPGPGLSGGRQMYYHDRHIHRSFEEDELEIVQTQLGAVVTATLSATVDVGSTTFTLVVPSAWVRPGDSTQVRTLGITAIHRMPFGPPTVRATAIPPYCSGARRSS